MATQLIEGLTLGGLKSRLQPGEPRVHLQVDHRAVACYEGPVRGQMHASRDPGEVTCPNCRKKLRNQDYDLVQLDIRWAERSGKI
jgi:hypothetical protein